jgi:hypothetical protein
LEKKHTKRVDSITFYKPEANMLYRTPRHRDKSYFRDRTLQHGTLQLKILPIQHNRFARSQTIVPTGYRNERSRTFSFMISIPSKLSQLLKKLTKTFSIIFNIVNLVNSNNNMEVTIIFTVI